MGAISAATYCPIATQGSQNDHSEVTRLALGDGLELGPIEARELGWLQPAMILKGELQVLAQPLNSGWGQSSRSVLPDRLPRILVARAGLEVFGRGPERKRTELVHQLG